MVKPSITEELILGVDFLKIFQVKVDFKDLSFEAQIVALDEGKVVKSKQNLSPRESAQLNKVVNLFKGIDSSKGLGLTHIIKPEIDMGDAEPISQRQYPLSPKMQGKLDKEIDEMLNMGIIKRSNSPWCSSLWLIEKKNAEFRVCFGGRKLNLLTKKYSYPMPHPENILRMLRGAKYIYILH